jgi:hypothetical protein
MDETFWVPDSSFFFSFFFFSGPIRDSYWCSKSQSHANSYPVKEKSKYLFFLFFSFFFFFLPPTRISTAVAGFFYLPVFSFPTYHS